MTPATEGRTTRPHTRQPRAHEIPRGSSSTRFARDINPWSQLPTMPKETSVPTTPASTTRNTRPRIDTSTMAVVYDVPIPAARVIIGKYQALFRDMKPKGSIQCDPVDVIPIANALRKYIKDKKIEGVRVVSIQRGDSQNADKGRVWLWPTEEAAPNGPDGRVANRNAAGSRKAKSA